MDRALTRIDRDQDFAAWCEQTAEALERREFDEVDWRGVVEEIRDLGRNDHRELKNRMRVLLAHLLKWQYQPGQNRSGSWAATIREQRSSIEDLLEQSPSLKAALGRTVQQSWVNSVGLAMDETGLPKSTFPAACPYQIDSEILN